MDFLVQKIVNKMFFFDLVSEHEIKYYNYYIELALEKMLAMSTIFVMAFWMDKIVETILFITAFSSIVAEGVKSEMKRQNGSTSGGIE